MLSSLLLRRAFIRPSFQRLLSTAPKESSHLVHDVVHFKNSHNKHPLKNSPEYIANMADHIGRQQNHIWSKDELEEKMTTLYRHKPKSISDHVMNKLMYSLYNIFNFITGYNEANPSTESIHWRLIVLESVAGVPGSFFMI